MPTQRIYAPSGKLRKKFVEILSVELDCVRAMKWIVDRVIVFQYVVLQRAHGINNSAQICKRILSRLNFWNRVMFDVPVKDMYNSDMGYFGKSRWNQTEEQCHSRFSNLVLKWKLSKAVQFVCDIRIG